MIYIATDNYKDGFPLSKAYDDTIYQKGNGEYYLKFRFPVDRFGVWKHLTCETILKADDTRGLQLFKIKKINKINGYIRVYCKHISDDLNYIGVDKLSVTNATGRRVMEALAGSTTEPHNFIFNSDIATMHTLNLSNTTAGKILSKDKHSIIGQWGGELVRDNFLVDLKARAGVDTEILFMNKKNVKNLDNVISTENLTTRLKLSVEKEHEGKKQTITATVDSPNINAYPRIYTNYLKVTNNNITTQEELIEYGKKYFRDKLVDFPTDNLTVNVIDKNQEQVKLFDTVWFRNIDFNIDKRLKVVAYEYSPMAKRYKKISFGALKVSNLSQIKSLSQLEDKIEEKVNESFVDAFKIQKNLSELLKSDRKGIEDKLVELEEKSKGALEVKKALFEQDGTIPEVVKTKILDAVEGDIGRLKTIITEAELIKAIQAKLNFAEIKNALIDKAFINQIISDEKFTQQFEDGEVTTQNIFTKLKDSIKSNISKEFMTKDGVRKLVNDLTIDADGIRQITQQESQKVFNTSIAGKVQEIVGEVKKNLPSKEELKGKSSYLHKKYSDYADGRNMSDNSTLKYIGIYTGDKEQAPTNASEYSWTKIRGEDGKSINRNYITDSKNLNNKVFYSWNKWDKSVEGDTLVLTKIGDSDTYGFYFNLTDLVKTQFQNEMLTWSIEIKASRNMTLRNVGFETNGLKQVDITTEWQKISHTFINKFTNVFAFVFYNPTANFNNGDKIYIRLPKLEKGNVATEWSPAYEDLQAHSLTANLRFEGKYINSITTDVKVYLDVYYDGQKVDTGFDVQLKDKGGTRTDWSVFWNSNVNDGLLLINKSWKNGTQNGQPLELIALVTYKGLNTIAHARMENIPDVVEIKEITKKYKTFESTIDRFDSTIGEVKKQVLANEEKRNLIIGSRLLNASDYSVSGKVWDAESKQGIYTQIRQSTGDGVNTIYNGNSYVFAVAQNNTQPVWQGVRFNISSKLLLPGRQYSLSIPYYILSGFPPDKGIFAEIKNHNTGRVVWKEELTSSTGYRQSWIEKKVTFRTDRTEVLSDYSFWIYAVQNGGFCISAPYMCEGDVLPKNYSPAPEDVHLQNSRLESSIKQTKDEIDLKVSKDNVIASINASVETTGEGPAQGVVKINADKVDISGVLRAYTGDIGGFRIGHNPNDGGGLWLTGQTNFDCGINPGVNEGSNGAQFWAAWGREWSKPGPNAWWVTAQGLMVCKNTPTFHKGMEVYGRYIDTHSNDIQGDKSGGGKTTVVWWSQINKANSSSSDKRLKTNIKPTKVNALDMLNNIEMVEFNWKKDNKFEKLGAIAQQVQSVEESFVVQDMDDKQTYNDYLRISYYNTIPYLIKAVQELSEENNNLKLRLQKLEDKINGNI